MEHDRDLSEALRNFEIHHNKRPLDGFRTYMGLEPITPEQFKHEVILEQDKIREIARDQRDAWEQEGND